MDERFQEVCCTIRACLNSNKGQCSLAALSNDYKSVLGESIPYHNLGFQSLEALVRAVPNLKVIRMGNEIFVDVKPDEKTMHITELVRGQRTAKKKSRKKSSYGRIYRSQAPPSRRPFSDVSQRRRPSSPPRNGRNYYSSNNNDNFSSRRRDPPPYQRKSSPPPYQRKPSPPPYQRKPSPPTYQRKPSPPNYQRKPNPPPIVISSEEEDYPDAVRRKYQSTRPSQYDFSDPNEFDDEGSDFDDIVEINQKMEALKVTLGREQRQVSVNNKQKMRGYQSTASYDDDKGYSSMKTNGYKNAYYSDSYEEDEDGYANMYVSTDNSSVTDQLESANSFHSNNYNNTNINTNSNSNRYADSRSNSYSNSAITTSNANRYANTNRDLNAYPNANTNKDSYSNRNANINSNSNSNRNTNINTNRHVDAYNTDIHSKLQPPAPIGRGYRAAPESKFEYSTNLNCNRDIKAGNIKVTVPNGTGRARAVAFLLR